jgi:hypothetical protein
MPNNDKSIGSRPTGRFDKDSGVHRENPSIGDIPTGFVEEQKSIHLEPGKVIGKRFEILEKLGSGGMGARIYMVRDFVMHGQMKALMGSKEKYTPPLIYKYIAL